MHITESMKAHEVAEGCALLIATSGMVKIAVL